MIRGEDDPEAEAFSMEGVQMQTCTCTSKATEQQLSSSKSCLLLFVVFFLFILFFSLKNTSTGFKEAEHLTVKIITIT